MYYTLIYGAPILLRTILLCHVPINNILPFFFCLFTEVLVHAPDFQFDRTLRIMSNMSSVSHVTRQRLGSVGDSAPPSDSSEGSGSETFEIVPDWALDTSSTAASSTHHHPDGNSNGLFINADDGEQNLDSMSLENSGILTETERAQVESFFSGLGTEVSSKRYIRCVCVFSLFVIKLLYIYM